MQIKLANINTDAVVTSSPSLKTDTHVIPNEKLSINVGLSHRVRLSTTDDILNVLLNRINTIINIAQHNYLPTQGSEHVLYVVGDVNKIYYWDNGAYHELANTEFLYIDGGNARGYDND